MPLLPVKNSLDFNPDAVIFASKKLKTIALERMKNPLEDPDFATLSTLEAQKRLGDSFERLERLAGQYHSLVLRLGNLFAKDERRIRLQREMEENWRYSQEQMRQIEDEEQEDFPDWLRDVGSVLSNTTGSGRKGKKGKLVGGADAERRRRMQEILRGMRNDLNRFRRFYPNDDRNSTATPAPAARRDFPDEPDIDDDDLRPPSTIYDDDIPEMNPGATLQRQMPAALGEEVGTNFNSLIFPLIQLTREMNMLLNSRIKPAIVGLTSAQISRLNDIYKSVRSSYNDVIFPVGRRARKQDPFTGVKNVSAIALPTTRQRQDDYEEAIMENNQFGDEILGVWNEERKSLLLSITVVVNSWKQNTPTGQQTELSNDITRSYQNTANRLGKKAELVEAMGQMPASWGLTGYTYENLQDLESVGGEGDQMYRDNSIPVEKVEEGFPGLRQYDKKGNLLPFGSGRVIKGRPKRKDTMTQTLVGSGRNFYGEPIDNSRDIPTIWRSYKDCPTKYLL